MAKKSIIARNKRRNALSARMYEARQALKKLIIDDPENQESHINKLNSRRRNESVTRHRNRCEICGRGHGTLRKFGLCRIHLREAMMRGHIPGLKKSSW